MKTYKKEVKCVNDVLTQDYNKTMKNAFPNFIPTPTTEDSINSLLEELKQAIIEVKGKANDGKLVINFSVHYGEEEPLNVCKCCKKKLNLKEVSYKNKCEGCYYDELYKKELEKEDGRLELISN